MPSRRQRSKHNRRSSRRNRARKRTRRSGGRRYRSSPRVETSRVVCSIDYDGCGDIVSQKDPNLKIKKIFEKFLKTNVPTHVFSASGRCFLSGHRGNRYINHINKFKEKLPEFVEKKSLEFMTSALDKTQSKDHFEFFQTAVLNFSDLQVFPQTMSIDVKLQNEFPTNDQTVIKYAWIYKQIFYAHSLFENTTIQKLKSAKLEDFDFLGQSKPVNLHNKVKQTQRRQYSHDDSEEDSEDDMTDILESYTLCTVEGDCVTSTADSDKYTEVFYTETRSVKKKMYNFYRNCSNKNKKPFTFIFMDDSFAVSVYNAIRDGTLPHPDETVILHCVQFNSYELPKEHPPPDQSPNLKLTYLTA